MFIPAAISMILFTLLLNYNIFTKEIFLFGQLSTNNENGKVMGVAEEGPAYKKNELPIDENGADRSKITESIANIIKNAREIAVSNTTGTVIYDVDDTAQGIIKKRNSLPKVLPKIESGSAAVYDMNTGKYLFSKETDKIRPIASITKLMSALVFIDTQPDWNKIYEIRKNDKIEGGRIILFSGDRIKVRDLFNLSLVGSDNMAIMALVHSSGQSVEEFVNRMNEKARLFGMSKTFFVDPTGLKDQNVSTAIDLTILARESFLNEDILQAVARKDYAFLTEQGRKKYIKNTDILLREEIGSNILIQGGKTGFNNAAGYCFIGKFIKNNRPMISVVLGAKGINSRFSETEKLIKWAYGE
jgi:serine-type D-Ala-D-Ala endopeptidase (penicillin-binding protein 7)